MSAKINVLIMVICYGLAFLIRAIPRNEKPEEKVFKIISIILLMGAILFGLVFLLS
ncbi:MAG: hypothetical protein NTU58_00430 [Candidatus Nealsonbacteria bacterium]|nr:hypothetical protein [Candidatus Nealsonbacteria bacterium]